VNASPAATQQSSFSLGAFSQTILFFTTAWLVPQIMRQQQPTDIVAADLEVQQLEERLAEARTRQQLARVSVTQAYTGLRIEVPPSSSFPGQGGYHAAFAELKRTASAAPAILDRSAMSTGGQSSQLVGSDRTLLTKSRKLTVICRSMINTSRRKGRGSH
jgi:hypothetical protein